MPKAKEKATETAGTGTATSAPAPAESVEGGEAQNGNGAAGPTPATRGIVYTPPTKWASKMRVTMAWMRLLQRATRERPMIDLFFDIQPATASTGPTLRLFDGAVADPNDPAKGKQVGEIRVTGGHRQAGELIWGDPAAAKAKKGQAADVAKLAQRVDALEKQQGQRPPATEVTLDGSNNPTWGPLGTRPPTNKAELDKVKTVTPSTDWTGAQKVNVGGKDYIWKGGAWVVKP